MTFKPRSMIIFAAIVFCITGVLRFSERSGLIDGTTGTRAFMVCLGLVVIAFGNAVPKQLKRPRTSVESERRMQNALRRVGWSMTLAGLLVSAVWMFAPDAIARIASLSALGLAFLVTVATAIDCRSGAYQRNASNV